ncbi:MAG: peptidase U32 family protein [Desulfomonilia bacterium]|jgi:putative protease|nr:peptidase U32 family protein [Deltaproteobacteria bacterium]HRS55156.1 peptidase U32 family protein [Desulfomonilia bacterium]HRV34775.1 peptidase U32 family protein [Desulfomonilia bacterium]
MRYISHVMKTPEILSPAGNREHLETACLYGADAVYLGVRGDTNLRAGARNFSLDELAQGVSYAHDRGVRVYLTLNTYPHDSQMKGLPDIVSHAREIGVDAVIVSDIGVLSLMREIAPDMPLHLSTQANTVNSRALRAWADLGISRVILARELSFEEISKMKAMSPVELEIFVHGSVCISISGRCLISNYLCSRDANQGRCTQPCRWDYALVERSRQGAYMPVEEQDGYTFLFNSKDLCLLPVMDKVMALGVDGLKIEGRGRTALYIASTVQTYRKARDAYLNDPQGFAVKPEWMQELGKISNRGYFTGFFLGSPDEQGINYDFSGYVHTHHLAAKVMEAKGEHTVFEARNPLVEGMEGEWLSSDGMSRKIVFRDMMIEGCRKERIRPNEIFEMKTDFTPLPGELVRKPYSEGDRVVCKETCDTFAARAST